ncbi:ParM/StbA family protein [Clostridium neonatale]|uniref:ParM/StbA family protein n=1 Tax=Clostridium neonatale TaxID=137838 RepID=UPI00291BC4E4|nr:plasmid segregation protein ParM [Clostridium neonatale]
MILGVDLGNYAVKTSERVHFLSKISGMDNFTEDNKVIYNNKKFYIGEGEFSTDWNKSRKENTLPLLFSAIYKSTNDSLNQVVIGSPIQQYKSCKQELKELIENNKCGIVNNKQIIITDIEIAPEGASAYYNIDLDIRNDIGNKQLIITDIGGRTTDISLFSNKKIADIKTIPVGMLNIYQDIIDYINTNYTENFTLEDGETVLKEGLFLNGENKDVSFIKPILHKHFNSIYKDLQLKFNVNKGYMYLTGGGSLSLQYGFRNRLKNLIISNDPIYDNVIGFKKVGEQLWQER